MISTEELFKLIENYIFAFSSKEELIKVVFEDDIDSFTTMTEEEIEKKVNENLSKYFNKQFEEEKLIEIIRKYIDSKGKALSKKNVIFLDNIIIDSGYELSYEDIQKLLEIKELLVYLNNAKKDDTYLVEQIKEFQELQELEEDEEEKVVHKKNYEGEDIVEKYYSDVSGYGLLTAEEERYYLKKFQEEEDPDAFEKLVLCNQGLCQKVARKYKNRGLSFLDLVQEGNLGLIKALQKFDLSKKTKLSTYAMWWIRQAIKRALNENSRTIRIPTHLIEIQEKISRATEVFYNDNGREPTIKEISELTGFTEQKIREAKKAEIRMVSFDKPVNDEESDASVLGDFLTSDDIETPEQLADKQAEHDAYELLFKLLREESGFSNVDRMEQIIRLRMGIEMYNDETYRIIKKSGFPVKDVYILEDVGKMFGVTRERIRQVQKKGIDQMSFYQAKYNINIFENKKYKAKVKRIKEIDELNKDKIIN